MKKITEWIMIKDNQLLFAGFSIGFVTGMQVAVALVSYFNG